MLKERIKVCANAQMECRFSLLYVTLVHHKMVRYHIVARSRVLVILAEMNTSSSSIDLSGDAFSAIL